MAPASNLLNRFHLAAPILLVAAGHLLTAPPSAFGLIERESEKQVNESFSTGDAKTIEIGFNVGELRVINGADGKVEVEGILRVKTRRGEAKAEDAIESLGFDAIYGEQFALRLAEDERFDTDDYKRSDRQGPQKHRTRSGA
jgi:hypothetical protein